MSRGKAVADRPPRGRGTAWRRSRARVFLAVALTAPGCGAGAAPQRPADLRLERAIPDSVFAALVERLSEPGGYFDTDNLISNESSYLKVLGALGSRGGAYVGVGPDQNFSYIARLRPEVAFIIDVRRDNLLQHLLLKALLERASTRAEFLAGLHGKAPPPDRLAWRQADIEAIVDFIDGAPDDAGLVEDLRDEVEAAIRSYRVPLADEDLETIARFHGTFIDAGTALRFTSYGRAPRPYYPTYRQLVLETDLAGARASYLASAEAYDVVRDLALANRIIPVVGDLSGAHAVREIGSVMREMGVELSAIYASNVEFYLWGAGTFERWRANLATLTASPDAVVIRSYFPNFGRPHPSSVAGYYSTQTLQPVATLLAGRFASYWEVVSRGALGLGG